MKQFNFLLKLFSNKWNDGMSDKSLDLKWSISRTVLDWDDQDVALKVS